MSASTLSMWAAAHDMHFEFFTRHEWMESLLFFSENSKT